MEPEDFIIEIALAVFVGAVGAVVLRWAIPRRFPVRRLLILTAAVAIFIAAYRSLAPH